MFIGCGYLFSNVPLKLLSSHLHTQAFVDLSLYINVLHRFILIMRPCMLSPGITGKPWYERSEFQWVPELEANVDVIKSEYMALQRDNSDYDLVEGEHTLHEGDWKWSAGKFLEILIIHVELAIRCMPAKLYTLHWHAERQHTHTRKIFQIHSPINIIPPPRLPHSYSPSLPPPPSPPCLEIAR